MKNIFKFDKTKDAIEFKKILISHGINCNISREREISVDDNLYTDALNLGLKYLNENLFLTLGNVYWYDKYNICHNIENKVFLILKLPNSRKMNFNYTDDIDYPTDITIFLNDLSYELCTKLICPYNENNNTITIEVEPDVNLEVIKNKTMSFLRLYEYPIPFENIVFYDEIKEEKKEESSSLRSYFNKSIFIESITNPIKCEKQYFHNYGYILEKTKNSIRNFNITNVKGSKTIFWREKIWGNFLLDEEKFYSDYKAIESVLYDCKNENNTFTMLDNGEFVCEIQKLSTETHSGIEVNTNIHLIRNVVGYDFDGYSARDEIFKNISHTDTRDNITILDYYYILNDPKVLIHFNSVNNDIDFYSKNNMYFLEDGIENEIKEITIPLEELENHEKYGIYYNEIAELIYSKKPSVKTLEKK